MKPQTQFARAAPHPAPTEPPAAAASVRVRATGSPPCARPCPADTPIGVAAAVSVVIPRRAGDRHHRREKLGAYRRRVASNLDVVKAWVDACNRGDVDAVLGICDSSID